jgi:LmbE family N-acetylglucosaminyl deacetylase
MRIQQLMAASWCVLVLAVMVRAQEHEPEAGLVALHQACLDASTDGVVLNVAAHPDDESSRTNAILRRKYGMRVVTVYSTYGDGGQNAIGREIGPELAHLRVRETLRAAAMSDVEVRWLGMPDFGFSKTLEETLKVWNGEVLKERMRKVLDRVEPDIIVTNHNLTQGHGHHRASYWAITELLKERAAKGLHVPPLYARCGVDDAQLTFDPAELEPARGETYARIAYRAWTQHVTQGPWGAHNPLQVGKDWWKLVNAEQLFDPAVAADKEAVTVAAGDLLHWIVRRPDGLERLPVGADRQEPKQLAAAATRLLAQARSALDQLGVVGAQGRAGGSRRDALRYRIAALERVLLALAGVRAEVWLDSDEVPWGGSGKAYIVVHGVQNVQDLVVRCAGVDATPAQAPVRNTPFDGVPAAIANGGPGANVPAPSATDPAEPKPSTVQLPPVPGRFVATFTAGPAPEEPSVSGPEPLFVDFTITFQLDGVPITLLPTLPYTPVSPIEVEWDRQVVMVPKGQKVERLLSASVTSFLGTDVAAPIRLSMGPGIQAVPIPSRLALSQEHANARLLVRTTIDADELTADAGIEIGFRNCSTRLRVLPVDVSVPPGLRVGLVRGPDDTIDRALNDLGISFVALDRDALMTTRLEDFTTVLLDIRASFHRPELAEVRDRLLQFVSAGGRVVSMYHKPGEWNERAGHPLLAPFPLTVGNDRVTEEDSPIVMLQLQHRLWQHPHAITAADFEGWVQERGLNFPSKWDTAWTPLLELKDSSDEKASQGALLHTQYGRGDFVYCSLALYRQLRVGNAGAARLLVNLLAK